MKKNKFLFVLLMLLSISVVAFGSTFLYVKFNNNNKLSPQMMVMTSCNPVYMATLNITEGVSGVRVENLSQPTTGCLHDYSLTTEDMKRLSEADALVINGDGMEGYLDDVVEAYPDLLIIDASEDGQYEENECGAQLALTADNSHMWLSYVMYERQIDKIARELSKLDAVNESVYMKNAKDYIGEIDLSIGKYAKDLEKTIGGSNIVVLHEAYEYIASDLGANVTGVLDLDEERQVSAGEVASTISTIIDDDVHIVFAEKDYGQSMGNLIEKSTDCNVVYLNTMIHGTYDADDYISVMKSNYDLISEACN